jgi:hypothetical protein
VVELRVPKVGGKRNRTDAGYFDDWAHIADAAISYNGRAHGIYITLNEVRPALLSRAANRIQEWAETTTSDNDIIRRRWLPIDIDPRRPAGISASEKEHGAALQRTVEIIQWLAAQGWPAPITADSGNGGHLLYRIDLPNDEAVASVIQRCLQALAARFDSAEVAVDSTVYNAARIWKLYGTKAAKGDHTPDRPHRWAYLIDVPEQVEQVTPAQLEALASLAAPAPAEQPKAARSADYNSPVPVFELASFISRHAAILNPSQSKQISGGSLRWRIDCPWDTTHKGDAVIIQLASGAISAKCSHNSCIWDWHALRDHLEPKHLSAAPSMPQPPLAPSPNGNAPAGAARDNGHLSEGKNEDRELKTRAPTRPVIFTNERQLADLMHLTMAAIVERGERSDPVLFVRSGRLVRLAVDEEGSLRTEQVTPDALLGIMAQSAIWARIAQTKDGGERLVNVSPPTLVSRVLCAAGGWDLPVLDGIAYAPIFGEDGTLYTAPGYNPATRLYHTGTVKLGDTTPTVANLAGAVALLIDELFVDFPLDDASRAHAIALAVLPFVLLMIKGPTPMHLATAPQHRAGKSLLIESALIPALGRPPAMTPDAGDEAEWAKVLTSKLLSSPSVVVLDNLSAELRSPMLATALSEGRLTSRILGSNTEVSAPARWTWAATARNPTLHEELMLRSVLIRLTPKTERPEERTGFKHAHQLEWVTANRDALATAIVTIVRNWIENAGGKQFTGRAKGRFDSWVGTMGGILEAAGINGFLANEAELRSTSAPEADAFRSFVLAWWDQYGSSPVTVSNELFKLASTPDDDKSVPGADLLGEVLGTSKEHGRKVALGSMLKRYAGRVYAEDSAPDGETPRSFQVSMHKELAPNRAKQWFLAELFAESPRDSAKSTTSSGAESGVSRSLFPFDVENLQDE